MGLSLHTILQSGRRFQCPTKHSVLFLRGILALSAAAEDGTLYENSLAVTCIPSANPTFRRIGSVLASKCMKRGRDLSPYIERFHRPYSNPLKHFALLYSISPISEQLGYISVKRFVLPKSRPIKFERVNRIAFTMSFSSLSPELISSVEADDLECLSQLLQTHPSSDVATLNIILALAIQHNSLSAVTFLISLGSSPLSHPALTALLSPDTFPTFQHLVTSGVLDINTNLDRLGTFLVLSVKLNNQEHVEFCLKYGANPDLGLYAHIWSPLATGANFGASPRIIELLLNAGASLEGSDALQTAAEKGRADLVRMLLEKGAKVDTLGFLDCAIESRAEEAGSALHFAVDRKCSNWEVVKLLLENGADVSLRDMKGRTVKERATANGFDDLEVILESL